MDNDKKYIFDKPKNIKRFLHFFYASCVFLFVLDFVIHRHTTHGWESLWGFYPLYGFVSCVVLVLVATWLRTILMRPADYYANEGTTDVDETSDAKAGGHDVDA